MLKQRVKTILALVWFAFTLTLVAWWWVYSLRQTEMKDSAHRMFFWEGSSLIGFIMLGGGMLVFLTYRDERRHERLRFFFSNFTHDIKTSISRLQLQAEVLKEEAGQQATKNPVLQRLVKDVMRLDLQLENSLWFANMEESKFYLERLPITDLLQNLGNDFEDLDIQVEGTAVAIFDRRAMASVFRNLFQNSLLHGKATRLQVRLSSEATMVVVVVSDNGSGFKGSASQLGHELLREQGGRGNGIGLMLSRRLMRKMHGDLQFLESAEVHGFQVQLRLPRGHA